MMRAMRANTKWIMLIVVLAFAGLMVFQWGMDVSGGSSPAAIGEVGRVNGTKISYQAWTRTYRNLADQARAQKGSALNDLELDLIEQQAWSQMVSQILIEQELRRRHITVTDEEVRLAFRTSPPDWLRENQLFQTDGQFDFDKYRSFFSGPATDPMLLAQIEAYYRDVLPRARLLDQVSTGIYVSDSEVWSVYRENTEQVRIRYLAIDPERIVEDSEIGVTEDELRVYYRAHREDFEQPATAETRLVQIFRMPGAADSAAALEKANDIRAEIMAGADFAEQANTHSSDRATGQAGGDLGWFERGDMAAEFEAAVFALEPGQISEPVLTRNGYHIAKMTESDGERRRASHILIPIELGGIGESEILGRVDRLERIGLVQGLEAAADSIGIGVTRITLAQGTDFVPGLGVFGPVHDWAFHDSTLIGELSRVYETNDAFYVFELDELLPAGIIPFEEAEAAVQRRVILEKKTERAREIADGAAARIRGGAGLSEAAGELGLEVVTSGIFSRGTFVRDIGQTNAVVGLAFGLGLNEIGGPIEAGRRIYFVEVVERIDADREAFDRDRETLRARLAFQRREAALERWLEALHQEADIIDNRREVFQPRS
ncbi:MAG: peptidyl-prolyl cis-trans isomerase [Gemmatimonadota bacterium]